MVESTQSSKVMMMVGAGKALDYKKRNPLAEPNEVMQHVVSNIDNEIGSAKVSAIAAADRAIKYKEQNPGANDKEIMQRIMNESSEILELLEEYNGKF